MTKRLEQIDIATADPDETLRVYRHNFALDPVGGKPAIDRARLELAGVAIRLVRTGVDGEADMMKALWLETTDAEKTLAALNQAGVGCGPLQAVERRRFFEVDRRFTNHVQLFIFDHKA